jgi:hypothetical protein
MTTRLAGFAVAFALCACPSAFAAPGDTWTMWQGDAGHTGYLPDTLLIEQRTFAWSERAASTAISGLAVSTDTVFTSSSVNYQLNGNLIAQFEAQALSDGSAMWTIDFAPGVTISAPAYADGRVFVVENIANGYETGQPYLSAFNAKSGTVLFRVQLPLAGTMYDSPTVSDGQVFFQLQVSNGPFTPAYTSFGSAAAANGQLLWQSAATSGDGRVPTWFGGRIYGYSTRLNVYDAASGASDGSIVNPADMADTSSARAPVIAGGLAYATQGGKIIAMDLSVPHVAWTKDVNASGQVATDGSSVFYLSAGALTLRDSALGTLQWGWEAPSGGPASTGGLLTDNFIITRTHVILTDLLSTYFIDRHLHKVVGSYSVGGLIALAADRLVIADAQGIVTVFRLPSDELFANAFE